MWKVILSDSFHSINGGKKTSNNNSVFLSMKKNTKTGERISFHWTGLSD